MNRTPAPPLGASLQGVQLVVRLQRSSAPHAPGYAPHLSRALLTTPLKASTPPPPHHHHTPSGSVGAIIFSCFLMHLIRSLSCDAINVLGSDQAHQQAAKNHSPHTQPAIPHRVRVSGHVLNTPSPVPTHPPFEKSDPSLPPLPSKSSPRQSVRPHPQSWCTLPGSGTCSARP